MSENLSQFKPHPDNGGNCLLVSLSQTEQQKDYVLEDKVKDRNCLRQEVLLTPPCSYTKPEKFPFRTRLPERNITLWVKVKRAMSPMGLNSFRSRERNRFRSN